MHAHKVVRIHIAANLYESHVASYGLTDIEDVGFLVQNNQKTINGLRERKRVYNEGGGGREREKERKKEKRERVSERLERGRKREALTSSVRPRLECSLLLSFREEAA